MNAIDQAVRLLERRLAELETERAALEQALAGIAGSPAGRGGGRRGRPRRGAAKTAAPTTHAKRSRAGAKRGAKRAPRGQRQAELLATIKAHPGAPVAELARTIGVRPQQVYPIAKRLTDAGEIAKRNGGFVAVEAKAAVETA